MELEAGQINLGTANLVKRATTSDLKDVPYCYDTGGILGGQNHRDNIEGALI